MVLAVIAIVALLGVAPIIPPSVFSAPANSTLRLNEVLADPASGAEGDANGDGVRSSSDDEFVEILNVGTEPVDLAGYVLRDSTDVRHRFPDSLTLWLEPGGFLTIFGGGDVSAVPGLAVISSEGGLSLNNGGDRVTLLAPDGEVADSHLYGSEGGRDRSLVRLPDGDGSWFLAGDEGSEAPFSPGRSNGSVAASSRRSWGFVKARLAAP